MVLMINQMTPIKHKALMNVDLGEAVRCPEMLRAELTPS
jgi:hypothetical protein